MNRGSSPRVTTEKDGRTMATFHFDLVSPEKLAFSGEVDQVDVPGTEGDFGVLAEHAPVIAGVRLGLARRHARNLPSPTVEAARMRERIFSAGALVSLTALSSWTLLAFCVTDNNFAHFIGVSMTIAYAFSLSRAATRSTAGSTSSCLAPLLRLRWR